MSKKPNDLQQMLNENESNTEYAYNKKDIYCENSDYDISSTNSKNMNGSLEMNLLNKTATYVEQLEAKIQQQAKRLGELNKYKYLCEKRIRQLNPNEILPITLDSLSINNQNNNKNILINEGIQKKYDILSEKFKVLSSKYNEILNNNNYNNKNPNDISYSNNSSINGNEKYLLLKEKYKKLKEENNKIIELLREETMATEEQKNIINVLRQAIEDDISKNSEIKNYITPENIVDFTQLKNESEEYRKELVLSQALVNSLKSEIEQLTKEKESNYIKSNIDSNNGNIRSNKCDSINNGIMNENNSNNNLLMSENISLKSNLNNQAQIIKELTEENNNLKKLCEEATIKLNDCINNNSENKITNDNLNMQLTSKMNEIKQYENKFTYFNDYISFIKNIFMKFQEILPKYINVYNKMANDDLNSLLSNSFSQSIIKLNNRIKQLNKIEKFNLETDIENDLYKIISELLQVLNNEFISIYEKVFQTNSYYEESNKKAEDLGMQIKNYKNVADQNIKKFNNANDLLLNEKKNAEEFKKNIEDLKLEININKLEKETLLKEINSYKNDKSNIINFYYIIIQILSEFDEEISALIKECVNILETKSKLYNEKEIIVQQLDKNRIKDLNCKNDIVKQNPELTRMIKQEQITLTNLMNEFDNKIQEKENQLTVNKEKLKQYLLNIQNKPVGYNKNNKFKSSTISVGSNNNDLSYNNFNNNTKNLNKNIFAISSNSDNSSQNNLFTINYGNLEPANNLNEKGMNYNILNEDHGDN